MQYLRRKLSKSKSKPKREGRLDTLRTSYGGSEVCATAHFVVSHWIRSECPQTHVAFERHVLAIVARFCSYEGPWAKNPKFDVGDEVLVDAGTRWGKKCCDMGRIMYMATPLYSRSMHFGCPCNGWIVPRSDCSRKQSLANVGGAVLI